MGTHMDNWSADKEFLQTFRAEAEERLHNLAEGLMTLENVPGDEELLKKLFREAHTLKGAAGMMGFDTVRDLSHRVEDLLSSVQKGQIPLNKNRADILLETLDRIEELLPDSDNCQVSEIDVSGLMERLALANDSHGIDSSNEEIQGGQTVRPVATPGIAAETPAQEPETPPRLAAATKTKNIAAAVEAEPSTRGADPTIRVNIEKLDKLLNLMGEILVNQIDSEGQVHELSDLQQSARELRNVFSSLADQVEDLKNNSGADQIASFSEKLIQAEHRAEAISGSIDDAASRFKENTASRRLALDELQDRTLQVRMLPLTSIFNIYPRVIRDASSVSSKIVRLQTSGEDTELDKRILEQISDPLMHIIRNCVDHGIEAPSARVAAGKPEQGTIRLDAYQRGDRVEIEIKDDGAGIDPDKLRKSAIEKGLLEVNDELSDEDLIDLIFRPGFSTAETITEISGRGVGLDVVKSNIEKLEGFVNVESEPGAGTRFTVSLPVTLAVIKGLLVESSDARFVIPLSSVKEMVAVSEKDIRTLGSRRSFLVRDIAIPLIDLLEYLGGGETERAGKRSQVVVVGSDKFMLGLEVGRLLGEQEVVIKPLGVFLGSLPYIAGLTILGSGAAVVVLNISQLARKVKEGTPGQHKVKHEHQVGIPVTRRKTVLVVEDSLVVRELQRNILETAGYDVNTAVDGADALIQLSQKPADCVVTDIEMPRMDGFDLTSAIRKTEDLRDTPVIMVTSLGNDSDKKRGIEAGADAYVIKGSFDQDILLNTIERLVA
ncbi:MAG: hybrid sensor histidine kinase/response regulator [Thermoleophilia bacterium]